MSFHCTYLNMINQNISGLILSICFFNKIYIFVSDPDLHFKRKEKIKKI